MYIDTSLLELKTIKFKAMVFVDSVDLLPESLKIDVRNAQNVIIFVQYGDELQCSLETLKKCSALKVGLINRGCLGGLPLLEENAEAFDYYIYYDGPDLEHMDFGNIKWLEHQRRKENDFKTTNGVNGTQNGTENISNGIQESNDNFKSQNSVNGETDALEIVYPEMHHAIEMALQTILPEIKNKNNVFLVSQNEEALIQTALLREKYGLRVGLSSLKTTFFVDKVAQAKFFEDRGLPRIKTLVVDMAELRDLDPADLKLHLKQRGVPEFPLFAKPVAGAGSFEVNTIANMSDLTTWVEKSEKYTYSQFLLQEMLVPPQYCCVVVFHPGGIETPHVCKSYTSFSDFILKGSTIVEIHLRREDPEFLELSTLAKTVFQAFLDPEITGSCPGERGGQKIGPKDYGCYFVEAMRKANGELAVTEVQCRYPAGFYVNMLAEDMRGVDVESFAIAWPFISYREDSSKIKYKHAITLMYPTKGGTLVSNNTPDASLFVGSAHLTHISHMFKPGDKIPDAPLTIVHVVAELAITGDDNDDVIATAKNIIEHYQPITTK